MSDNDQQPTEYTRRGILGGILSTAALPYVPLSSLVHADTLAAHGTSSTLYQFFKHTLMAESAVGVNFNYLQTLGSGEEIAASAISEIAEYVASNSVACNLSDWPNITHQLLQKRPSPQAVFDFLKSPECSELFTQYRIPAEHITEIGKELLATTRLSPMEIARDVASVIEDEQGYAQVVKQLAFDHPEIAQKIKSIAESRDHSVHDANPSNLHADMSWWHKTAGYPPVSKSGEVLSNEEQAKLQIGLHTPADRVSSCENYGSIIDHRASLANHYTK